MNAICTCCGREFDTEDFFDDDKYDESTVCPDCLFTGNTQCDEEDRDDDFDDDLDLENDDLDDEDRDLSDFFDDEELDDDFDESRDY